jgi:hypothetical protein
MAQSSWIIIPPFLWTVTDNWIGINRRLWPSAERVDLIRGQFHISAANMSGPWTSRWQICRLIFLEHSDASCLAAATFDLPDEGIDTCDSPDDCAYYPASTCLPTIRTGEGGHSDLSTRLPTDFPRLSLSFPTEHFTTTTVFCESDCSAYSGW